MEKKILPWVPVFGGVYCHFYALHYFNNYTAQILNFFYHVFTMVAVYGVVEYLK